MYANDVTRDRLVNSLVYGRYVKLYDNNKNSYVGRVISLDRLSVIKHDVACSCFGVTIFTNNGIKKKIMVKTID